MNDGFGISIPTWDTKQIIFFLINKSTVNQCKRFVSRTCQHDMVLQFVFFLLKKIDKGVNSILF